MVTVETGSPVRFAGAEEGAAVAEEPGAGAEGMGVRLDVASSAREDVAVFGREPPKASGRFCEPMTVWAAGWIAPEPASSGEPPVPSPAVADPTDEAAPGARSVAARTMPCGDRFSFVSERPGR